MILDHKHNFRRTHELISHILDNGTWHDSRLGRTSELIDATLNFTSWNILYREGMSRKLGMVELLQVLSGYFDERHILKAAPNLRYKYGLVHAYGIKIAQQLPKVIKQLRENPETRRAIIYIGKPEDGQEVEKPCIQLYQFQIRDGFLMTSVYARSWDAVSGLPYDAIVAGGLSQVISHLLDTHLDAVTFHASSLHVYHDVWDKILVKHYDKLSRPMPYDKFLIWQDFQDFDSIREWAIDQLNDIDNWRKGLPNGIND